MSHYEIPSRDEDTSPLDFLNGIRTTVLAFVWERPQSKIQISLICEMMRTDPAIGNITNVDTVPFNSYQESVYDSTDLEATYERMVAKMLESFSEFLKNESGWTLKRIIKLDINFGRNKPVKGSSKILLPKKLANKGALINMDNEDDYCFMYAATRALNMIVDNPQRVNPKLMKQAEELNWDGIEFPKPCSERMYKKFEENNDVSLLVFGHEDSETRINIIPLYVPKERRKKTIRLFFLKDGENSHYCALSHTLSLRTECTALLGLQIL